VLYGLWIIQLNWAELPTAYETAKLCSMGQDTQTLLSLLRATMGWDRSCTTWESLPQPENIWRGIALYDSRQFSSSAIRPVQDPGVLSRGFAAWSLWHLGYPDQALQRVHESFALAQELSHPFSFACLELATNPHQWRKEPQLAQERAEAMLVSSEHGFPIVVASGTFRRGARLVALPIEKGLAQMRQGLETYLVRGTELGHPSLLGGLASAPGA
jgi:hypothetical protein